MAVVIADGSGTAPLRKAAVNLWGANADAYVEFGITQVSPYPNFLVDIGFGLQPLYGTVQLNDKNLRKFLLNTLAYVEFDLVFFRFGKAGEVTLYSQGEAGSTALQNVKVDGDELMVHLEQGRRGRALVNVCSRSEQQLGVNLGIWG